MLHELWAIADESCAAFGVYRMAFQDVGVGQKLIHQTTKMDGSMWFDTKMN